MKEIVLLKLVQAYVGGLYRDQGAEVVSKWLMSLLRPHVKLAYQSVREAYLLPPETGSSSQLEAPTAYQPSPFSSASFEDAGTAFPSYPPGFPRDHRQLTPPEASVPQQGSAQAGDGVGTRRAVNDKPRSRRRRRRSTLKDVGCEDAGEQVFPKGIMDLSKRVAPDFAIPRWHNVAASFVDRSRPDRQRKEATESRG